MFTAILMAAALSAAEPSAPVTSAAPVGVDIAAMKAGQLPAAGTREEADSCAAETTFMLIVMVQSGKLKSGDVAKLADPMDKWAARAAAFRPMDPKAYSGDKAVADAAMALVNIDLGTNAALETACVQRLAKPDAK
ncbi:hypothetical protein [Asticcacaulis solisilvae]|uniref:hypothetical protein n=1 Tax=Asticcacaulis solisilvae TaxID=1217274 RepID=UPI003FD81583